MGKCYFDDINKGRELQFKLSFTCLFTVKAVVFLL